MYCHYCNHVIVVPSATPSNTKSLNMSVKVSTQDVHCSFCGAEYHIEITYSKKPSMTVEQLIKLQNRSHREMVSNRGKPPSKLQ